MKVKQPIYLKDAQRFLDECIKTREHVSILALKADGTPRRYDGWLVASSHWKAGTHTFRNPQSGQLRKIRDILIFKVNDHPIYI